MSTKVKGDAIKEGSIPLSALDDGLNATIENKIGLTNCIGVLTLDTPINFNRTSTDTYTIINGRIIKINMNNEGETDMPVGPPFKIKCVVDYPKVTLSIISQFPDAHQHLKLPIFLGINKITDEFLPNTVIKTTPQLLSDTDRNQALANLGIDLVVWKYMMNPFIIYTEQENPVPDDLLSIIDNNGSLNLNPIILKLIVVKHEHENSVVYNIDKVEPTGVYYNYDAKIYYSNGVFIWQ